MKIGILRFPGTNCDRDIWQAVEVRGQKPSWLWHADRFDHKNYEAFILPGGFSYGDYLRSGALAAHAPAMQSLREAALAGKPIFGICNGFQILCEAQLLPGVLMQNEHRRFRDEMVELKMAGCPQFFAQACKPGQHVRMPIAHGDGRYYADAKTVDALLENEQVFCYYTKNPNGSVKDIAGVMNKTKNIVGMMPHPERALFDWMGSGDGLDFF